MRPEPELGNEDHEKVIFFPQLDKEGSLTADQLATVSKVSVMLAKER